MRALFVIATAFAILIATAGHALAAPPSWYPPLEWLPASSENFDVGRNGTPITGIVIHATGGRYAGTLTWFQDPHARLSAHYVIRASDGEITQMVPEKDTAFHVRGANRGTIGIEHEFDPVDGIGYTAALYRSSATLVCAIARRYGIPLDRAHILGHSEVAGADHADPGPTWDWTYYMGLVSRCANGATVAPAPLSFGMTSSAVTQLQRDLSRLGYMSAVTGYFGPITERAVRQFQVDNGVASTGTYGPLTRAALLALRR